MSHLRPNVRGARREPVSRNFCTTPLNRSFPYRLAIALTEYSATYQCVLTGSLYHKSRHLYLGHSQAPSTIEACRERGRIDHRYSFANFFRPDSAWCVRANNLYRIFAICTVSGVSIHQGETRTGGERPQDAPPVLSIAACRDRGV